MGLERINEMRKAKGMSIDELCAKSGIPKSTISKITAGITTNPTLDTMQAIARALGCRLDDFDDAPPIEISPAPAEASTGEISLEESNNLLVALGYIKPGKQISDEDLAFLEHIIGLLDAWFGKGL